MAKSLYLIDTHYQIYRAFYGLTQPLMSPRGEPTAATHVFFTMLFALIRTRRPDYLAMVMDVSDETTFRRDLDATYKAQRDAAPEALGVQAERIIECVRMMGIPVLRQPGYEADDLMACIAERLRGEDIDVFLVSKDKDLEQLISDRVKMYDAAKEQVIDAAALWSAKGYWPEQAVEIQTLVGDSTDNIPGVVGVGPKTAAKLINQYGSAKSVIEHADELTPKMKERVKEFAPKYELTRTLVTLCRDVPCDFDLQAGAMDRWTPDAVKPVFKELGLNRLNELMDALPRGDRGSGAGGREELRITNDELRGRAPASPESSDRSIDDSGHAGEPRNPPERRNSVVREGGTKKRQNVPGAPGSKRPNDAIPASLFPDDDPIDTEGNRYGSNKPPELEDASLARSYEERDEATVKSEEGKTSDRSAVDAITKLPNYQITKSSAEYCLIDSLDKLHDFVAKLERQDEFAFDTETTGVCPVDARLVGISFCWRAGEAYFIPVRAAVGDVLPVEAVAASLKPIFENPKVKKIGHNLKFDTVVLRQVGINVRGLDFDTLLASFVLEPMRQSHGLDALAKAFFDHDMIPITDLMGRGRKQMTLEHADTRWLCEYAGEDAEITWRLAELMRLQMAGSDVEPLFRETEMPLIEVLVEMENNGVALDPVFLKKLGVEMDERLRGLTRQVHEAAGHEFNIDSTKQLAEVLFTELKFPVVRKTKTGRSTDAETLEALAAQTDHPVPKLLLEYRELSKLKNTYVDTLPQMVCRRTGRVHASFHQTGAVTGRLSSSDPNLQNIPIRTETGKQIRRAFVAGSHDALLLAADYSQIELRLLAHFSEDRALIEAFEQGLDIHRAVAAQVNNVPLAEVSSAQRSAAKAVNFGIIYGQTPFGLSKSIGISKSEAQDFITAYFARYPGIREFIDRCIAEALRKGYAQTILGRRRPIPELHSRNRALVSFGERIAVNTVVQGSAADLIKRAMIDIHRDIQGKRLSARMLLQVHDELVFEVPQREVESAAKIIREEMEKPFRLKVPIVADLSWGRTWADTK